MNRIATTFAALAEQKRKAEEAEQRKVEAAERAVREAEEAKAKAAADFAADVADEKVQKQAKGEGALPVPEHNPGMTAVVEAMTMPRDMAATVRRRVHPRALMIWNVATWVVTAGTSVASRNMLSTAPRPVNRTRSTA